MASFPKASHRARRIAYVPRLDVAIKANAILHGNGARLGAIFTTLDRDERLLGVSLRDQVNTALIAFQVSNTPAGSTFRQATNGEDEGAGGSHGGIKP